MNKKSKDTVIVTGANGFIGRRLCNKLRKEAFRVVGITRRGKVDNADVVIKKIDGNTDWHDIFKCTNAKTIVHLAAVVDKQNQKNIDYEKYYSINTEGTLRIVKHAIECGVEKFIFVSTVKVNGEYTDQFPFREDSKPVPLTVYGKSKYYAEIGIERLCKTSKMNYVIFRPPLVYGPGMKGNLFNFIELISRHKYFVFPRIKNKRSYLFVDNLNDAIVKAIQNTSANNKIFMLSDGRDLSTPELIKLISKTIGVKTFFPPCPLWVIKSLLIIFGYKDFFHRLTGSLQIEMVKINNELGWFPPHSIENGLRVTVERFRKQRWT